MALVLSKIYVTTLLGSSIQKIVIMNLFSPKIDKKVEYFKVYAEYEYYLNLFHILMVDLEARAVARRGVCVLIVASIMSPMVIYDATVTSILPPVVVAVVVPPFSTMARQYP